MRRCKYLFVMAALVLASLSEFLACSSDSKHEPVAEAVYKNLSDTARYVGMQTCRQCHENVYATFIHTGMGQSMDHATRTKSKARFDKHAYVYDKYKNFWYHPFWMDDSLYIKEFRLKGKDTVYVRIEKVSYIVGSGQHTNSHIRMENGYLFQAPLTFYTQKQMWDLPPGFEDGMNSRWDRAISLECMNCHNMYPRWDDQSDNRFISIKTGIECERCHGPGSIHVQEKMKGILVDTSKAIDYSIVNPKNLPRDLQVEVCERCHLQGISVLNEGKTFFDFKPGMYLNEVENVFMPRYAGNPDKFIMASHVDRMKQSKCYLNSQMTCLTCHNPHISVTVTPPQHFNNACISCHTSPNQECTLPLADRMKQENNCFQCHMPLSETLDIPHVKVHDHRIHIPVSKKDKADILKFIGLQCMTQDHPSDLLMAKGYLQTYEAYSPQPFLLDSAKKYIDRSAGNDVAWLPVNIRWYFLEKNYGTVTSLAASMLPAEEKDEWTLYRVGESYFQQGDFVKAEKFYSELAHRMPHNTEYLNKQGSAMMALGKTSEAETIFQTCVKLNPSFAPAVNNLGYVFLLKGDTSSARSFFSRALGLDPDYIQAMMNVAALSLYQNNYQAAKGIIGRVLQLDPGNEKAKLVLGKLDKK